MSIAKNKLFASALFSLSILFTALLLSPSVANAATLSTFSWSATSLVAGASSTYTFDFTTVTSLSASANNTVLNVVFPNGFNLSGANTSTTTLTVDGVAKTLSLVSVGAQRAVTVRSSVDIPGGSHVIITLSAVNGPSAGTFSMVNVRTENSGGTPIDTPASVNSIVLTAPVYTAPTPSTGTATNITGTSVTLNGSATAGTDPMTFRGFIYDVDSSFANAQSVFETSAGFSNGSYSLSLTGLTCNTSYVFYAYASDGTSSVSGSNANFTTATCAPSVTTDPTVTDIAETSVTLHGSLTAHSNAVTARGFMYGVGNTGTVATETSTGFSSGAFSQTITGLTCATIYSYKATATASPDTVNGTTETFSTAQCPTNTISQTTSGASGGGGMPVSVPQAVSVPAASAPSISPNTCPVNQILTQDMKTGARNGVFNAYTGTKVTEATILQGHLNRLGFQSGTVDGILGPITDGAIKRMQVFLGTVADGMVGPITRSLINNSCGSNGLQH